MRPPRSLPSSLEVLIVKRTRGDKKEKLNPATVQYLRVSSNNKKIFCQLKLHRTVLFRIRKEALNLLDSRTSFLPRSVTQHRRLVFGKGTVIKLTDESVQKTFLPPDLRCAIQQHRAVAFPKGFVDIGISVREHQADGSFLDAEVHSKCSRNHSVISDHDRNNYVVRSVVAVLDEKFLEVESGVLFVEQLHPATSSENTVGTKSVKCKHFGAFAKPVNANYTVLNFSDVAKHLYVYKQVSDSFMYSTPPSVYRTS